MPSDRRWDAGIAAETLHALEAGHYGPEGHRVALTEPVQRAIPGTVTYPPESLAPDPVTAPAGGTVEVRGETTLAATHRLAAAGHWVVARNFASGRTPGGGFLRGAIAQATVARLLAAALHGPFAGAYPLVVLDLRPVGPAAGPARVPRGAGAPAQGRV